MKKKNNKINKTSEICAVKLRQKSLILVLGNSSWDSAKKDEYQQD